ncbi:hypothetical protein [Pedobacter frigiditerrae]|uniref:hypothetical protein n=1 Tax=Pedobacter frigiditerrae TaxID=2530452 RepID=UPI0021D0D633|nr:hypothetical protein [Pedobacter frigiditerrae]
MATAPVGYINKTSEAGKKYIDFNQPQATLYPMCDGYRRSTDRRKKSRAIKNTFYLQEFWSENTIRAQYNA